MAEANRGRDTRMTLKDFGGLAICCGGMVLASFGCNNLSSPEERLSSRSHECVLQLTAIDPPVYSPKSSSELCQKIDGGATKAELLAELTQEANSERPWGTVKIFGGLVIAGGAFRYLFAPSKKPQKSLTE